MKIFRDRGLTESVGLDGESFALDLGTTQVGSSSTHTFYLHNEKDCELQQMVVELKPVKEIKEGKERDYIGCLEEVTILGFPKHMKQNETKQFEITYAPKVDYFRSLKLGIEISAIELPL